MSILVTDHGFTAPPEATAPPLAAWTDETAVTLGPTDRAKALAPHLAGLTLVRIAFPAFNDGRGFGLARDLRRLGYTDQYAMARRPGLAAAEIPAAIAARQPWPQWQARADWKAHDHRARLFA